VRRLVGRLLGKYVVPATEEAQEVEIEAVSRAARLLGPRLVRVVGQQGAAVRVERLGGEHGVAGLQSVARGAGELPDVDLDVVAAGEECDQLLAQHDRFGVLQRPAGVVRSLVESGAR
jgi:hypothetical protein